MVALNIEARDTSNTNLVSTEEGFELSQKIAAAHFVECSVCRLENIDTAFLHAVDIVLNAQIASSPPSKKQCSLQ